MLPSEDNFSCSLLISDYLSRNISCRSAISCSFIMHPLQLFECSMCMKEKGVFPGLVTWAWGAGDTSGTWCPGDGWWKSGALLGKGSTGCTDPITWCGAVVTGVKLFGGGEPQSLNCDIMFSARCCAAWIRASWAARFSARMAESKICMCWKSTCDTR